MKKWRTFNQFYYEEEEENRAVADRVGRIQKKILYFRSRDLGSLGASVG